MIGPSRSPGRRSHCCRFSSWPTSSRPGGAAAGVLGGRARRASLSACLSASNIGRRGVRGCPSPRWARGGGACRGARASACAANSRTGVAQRCLRGRAQTRRDSRRGADGKPACHRNWRQYQQPVEGRPRGIAGQDHHTRRPDRHLPRPHRLAGRLAPKLESLVRLSARADKPGRRSGRSALPPARAAS